MAESLEALKLEKVYSHIRRDNAPSIAAHTACGFRKILDHATYLDGSVHLHSDTYLYENPRCT
jgi:L-amino acid N-acyltransferase YncA